MIEMDEKYWAAEFARLRWPDGWRCDVCGSETYWQLTSRPRVFQCSRKGCRAQRSVTAGTVLEGTHLPLGHWMFAIAKYAGRWGVSARGLARLLQVHVQTAWRLLHRIRACLDEPQQLEGACSQHLAVQAVTHPARFRAAEVAYLADEHGHARILVGEPRVDRSLGLEGWDALEGRLAHLNRKRGVRPDPKSLPTSVERAPVFAPDVTDIADACGRGPAEALRHALGIRVRETYRHVSAKWLGRYTAALATLFTSWAGMHRYDVTQGSPELSAGILGRCLAHRRATFRGLVPRTGLWLASAARKAA